MMASDSRIVAEFARIPTFDPARLNSGEFSYDRAGIRIASCCCIAVLALAARATADDALPPLLQGVNIEQRLGEQVPLDLAFRDETGQPVRLRSYFTGKPVVLVLAYYRCPRLCTEVLNGLESGLEAIPLDLGREFNVLTVSFDSRETPELAAAKKVPYVEKYGRSGAADGWHFLTGDETSIKQLTDAVGFHYHYDPRSDQFVHASGIMILTPEGKLARYFYGIHYSPRDLRLGLVEASADKIGSPVDQLLLFCFHYDPTTGQYTPAIMNFVRLAGAVTLAALIGFMFKMWHSERHKIREPAAVR
jgi:protein SCO1